MQEDLGSLKVFYITSNRIYSSHSERLHNNTEYTVMYSSCICQIPRKTTVCDLFYKFNRVTREGEILWSADQQLQLRLRLIHSLLLVFSLRLDKEKTRKK